MEEFRRRSNTGDSARSRAVLPPLYALKSAIADVFCRGWPTRLFAGEPGETCKPRRKAQGPVNSNPTRRIEQRARRVRVAP